MNQASLLNTLQSIVDKDFELLVGALAILCFFSAFVIVFIAIQIRKAYVAKWEMLFQQDLLDQGLSIEEIERLTVSRKALFRRQVPATSGVSGRINETVPYQPGGLSQPLVRSATNRTLAGVLGGFADFFGVDATILRVLFVLVTLLAGGAPLLIYFVAAMVMPDGKISVGSSLRSEFLR